MAKMKLRNPVGFCLAEVGSGSSVRDTPIRPHSFHEDGRGGQVVAGRLGLDLTKEHASKWRRGEIDDSAAVHGVDDVAQEPLEEQELVAFEEQEHAEVAQRAPTLFGVPAVTCLITSPHIPRSGQPALTTSRAEARSLGIPRARRWRVAACPQCRSVMAS